VKRKIAQLQKRNDKLRKKLSRSGQKKARSPNRKRALAMATHLASKFLNGLSLEFFTSQMILAGAKGKKGNRYSDNVKLLALSLYNASPKCYRLLRKVFQLPCVSTLRSCLRHLQFEPGFQHDVLAALSRKMESLPDFVKDRVVVFDEMAIKESVSYDARLDRVSGLEDFGVYGTKKHVANHASVFLVRGLHSRWKQPFGFFFSSGTIAAPMLKNLVCDSFDALHKVGFRVKAFVCDQGSNNRLMMKKLGLTSSNPVLRRNDEDIHFFYDTPHLIKNIRNNLRKSGFIVDSQPVLWKFIQQFYEIDSSHPIRLAPKLSSKHINLPPFKAMSVKLATQVLSHSLGSGISLLSSIGKMSPHSLPTGRFCEKMDCVFNIFNSYSTHNANKFKRAFSSQTEQHHLQFLSDAQDWFGNFRLKRPLPCIEGWKQNICALQKLWDCAKVDHPTLCTSRLNQDCIENFFSLVRGRGGYRENPSTVEFVAAYRSLSVDFLFVQSAQSNCQADADVFALKLQDLSKAVGREAKSHQAGSQSVPSQTPVVTEDLVAVSLSPPQFSVVEGNIIVYLAGYLVRKALKKFPGCSSCVETIVSTESKLSISTLFLNAKLYDDSCHLLRPTSPVIEFVSRLEKVFRNLTPRFHTSGVMQSFIQAVGDSVDCSMGCCDAHMDTEKYVVQLFFIVRINHYLRDQNKDFKETKRRRNRKMMKLIHA
jgi:hypothetical protein